MPIELIAQLALQAITLATKILEDIQKGATQDDLNKQWADMQAALTAANSAWDAAGGKP